MVKQFFILIGVLFSIHLMAQTGIGTITPHASAKLDVTSTDKGFLPPRIALTGTNDVTTIASPATGLIIYNTATAGTSPNNVLPGYYYWDGLKWNGLVDQGALDSFSGYVPNYAQSNASKTSTGTADAVIISQSITTSGRPIQIIATGDANPASAAWCQLQLYRDGVAIGKKVQAESSSGNENVPYCLNFIDNPTAGTYTYSVRYVTGSGSFQFGEADGNHITLLELGAWSAGTMPVSKGGTGNSSYTAGSVIFSDGTNLGQSNTNLFWDNTNGRLGIGTNTPTSRLNIAGGGVKLVTGFGNSTNRPSLNTSIIGNYEIRGVGSISGNAQNDLADDGFLRLSAGGGTSVSSQSSIDISGFSTVADMSNNIVMRTVGTERMKIDNSGNVGIGITSPTEKLEVSGNIKANNFIGTASSTKLFLLEAYSNASYSMPGSYTNDLCRYNIVNNTVNVPSSWFNTLSYTFTPQKAGYWEIRASYDVYRSGEATLMIYKNGSNVAVVSTISSVALTVNKIIYLNGTSDYINIYNSGVNSNTRSQGVANSWFQARWVGE